MLISLFYLQAIAIIYFNTKLGPAADAEPPPDLLRSALLGIYEHENLTNPDPSAGPLADDGYYRTASDDELADVYGHINRETHPERFTALLAEIKRRVESQPGDV